MSHCKGIDCMTKLKIDNPLLEAIEDYAFGANGNLKTVEMGENPSLTTYREGVFLKSPVEDIIIPKNMTYNKQEVRCLLYCQLKIRNCS